MSFLQITIAFVFLAISWSEASQMWFTFEHNQEIKSNYVRFQAFHNALYGYLTKKADSFIDDDAFNVSFDTLKKDAALPDYISSECYNNVCYKTAAIVKNKLLYGVVYTDIQNNSISLVDVGNLLDIDVGNNVNNPSVFSSYGWKLNEQQYPQIFKGAKLKPGNIAVLFPLSTYVLDFYTNIDKDKNVKSVNKITASNANEIKEINLIKGGIWSPLYTSDSLNLIFDQSYSKTITVIDYEGRTIFKDNERGPFFSLSPTSELFGKKIKLQIKFNDENNNKHFVAEYPSAGWISVRKYPYLPWERVDMSLSTNIFYLDLRTPNAPKNGTRTDIGRCAVLGEKSTIFGWDVSYLSVKGKYKNKQFIENQKIVLKTSRDNQITIDLGKKSASGISIIESEPFDIRRKKTLVFSDLINIYPPLGFVPCTHSSKKRVDYWVSVNDKTYARGQLNFLGSGKFDKVENISFSGG